MLIPCSVVSASRTRLPFSCQHAIRLAPQGTVSEQSLQIMVISRVEVDTTWTGLAGVVPSQQHGSVAFAGNFRTVDPHAWHLISRPRSRSRGPAAVHGCKAHTAPSQVISQSLARETTSQNSRLAVSPMAEVCHH